MIKTLHQELEDPGPRPFDLGALEFTAFTSQNSSLMNGHSYSEMRSLFHLLEARLLGRQEYRSPRTDREIRYRSLTLTR